MIKGLAISPPRTYLGDRDFLRWVLRLALPATIQMLLYNGINALNNMLTDAYFGSQEMSAVAQAATIFSIYEVITYGFSGSCGVLVAQYWGKQDRRSIQSIISITLRFELALGFLASCLMLFAPQAVMSLMSNDPAVIRLGSDFLRTAVPNYFLFGLVETLYAAYSSLEMVHLVFWGNILCYSVNLSLSYLLIPRFGVTGAAAAAVLARVVDFLFVAVCLLRNKQIRFSPETLIRFNRGLLGDYMHTVYPIMGHELFWSVGTNMSSILMGRLDTNAVSAYSMAYMFYSLLAAFQTGISKAASAIVGKSIGEGDKERAQRCANTFVVLTALLGLLLSACLLILHPLYLGLYSNVSGQVLEYARGLCLVLSVVMLFHGFDGVVLVSILRAGGMGKVGMFTDMVVMWMIGIPLGWLAIAKGINPVWVVALVKVDMPLKSLVGVYYVLAKDWIHNLARGGEQPQQS